MQKKRIYFKDLSLGLKIAISFSYFIMFIWIVTFTAAFMGGFFS